MHSSDIFVVAAVAPLVGALALSVHYATTWYGRWRAAALAPVVLLAGWLVAVLLRWPSEHTLWPFELLLYGPIALVYILIMRWLERRQGTHLRRLMSR